MADGKHQVPLRQLPIQAGKVIVTVAQPPPTFYAIQPNDDGTFDVLVDDK